MSDTKIITSDAVTRRTQSVTFEGDKVVLNTAVDVEPVLLQSEFERTHLWGGSFHGSTELRLLKAASIPMTTWLELRRQGILRDRAALRRWLADHPRYKTTDGNAV